MRRLSWVAALVLVAAACGDSGDSGEPTTTTGAPPATTTPATTVPPTTVAPTTTRPPPTTTTTRPATPPETTTSTTTVPIVVPEGALPDVPVPPRLVDAAVGSADFGTGPEVLESNEDWFLLLLAGTASILPVPAGWEVDDRIDAADVTYGALDDGGVEAFVQRDATGLDVAELIADIESDVNADEGGAIYLVEVDDAGRAFVSGASRDSGTLTYGVAVLSVDEGGELLLLSAAAAAPQWARFEPVFRAMQDGWYDTAGNWLGVELPPDLLFPPVDEVPDGMSEECVVIVDDALALLQGVFDQLTGVTVEEWEASDEDVAAFIDVEAFDAAGEDIDARVIAAGCDEDDLDAALQGRVGELVIVGDVAALAFEQFSASLDE